MRESGLPFTRRKLLRSAGGVTGMLAATAAKSQTQPKYNAGQKVRIGIVGGRFGAQFQWHLDPDCAVAAVCDIRPDRLQQLAEVYHCPNTYSDFHRMLSHPGLN